MASEKDRGAAVDASESKSPSRRTFLLVAGAASAAALVRWAGSGGSLVAEAARVPQGAAGARKARVIESIAGRLAVGTPLHTSTVAAVHPVKLGGIAVVARRPDGTKFQLDVLRRAEHDGSIAQSARLSVFVVNGGTGSSATSEPDGLAAMALARSLAAAELAGMPEVAVLTHEERACRNPAGAFCVAV